MQGGALVTPAPAGKNDVFLTFADKIKVTGVLGHHPAARITPHSYYERVVVEGAFAEETNFTVTPNGSESWRCEKVGNQLKLKKN